MNVRNGTVVLGDFVLAFGLLITLLPLPAEANCTNCTTTEDGDDIVHTFTSGNGTFTPPSGVTSVQYLIVGGGGGGGGLPSGGNLGGAGGGGAGGYRTDNLAVTPGNTLNVSVGAGGTSGVGGSSQGGNGGNSFLGSVTAIGGGGGASNGVNNTGEDGGSGGGGRVTGDGGNGTPGQGNNGGDGANGGGGGGGAGSAGDDGGLGVNGGNAGSGGNGQSSAISGANFTYSVGGEGGAYFSFGGGNNRSDGSDASANTGNGGEGATGANGGPAVEGGSGGSGIVIVRYPKPAPFECPAGTELTSGILGSYYDYSDESFPSPPFPSGTPTGTRVDGPVDFDWGSGEPGVQDIDDDEFAVAWDGALHVENSGSYQFQTVSDDGVRLFVNDQLVINNWTDHASTTNTSNSVSLTGGQTYSIRLEFYENGGQAEIRLRWRQGGSGSFSAIPAGPEGSLGNGLYYCAEPPEPEPVLEFRMDEASWNGSNGEVVDETGNGNNGTARNGADTEDTSSAIPGDPGTCGYGTFDGNNDYVQVNNLSSLLSGTASLAFWIRTEQTSDSNNVWDSPGIIGVEESGGTDDIFWGTIDDQGRIGLAVGNDDDDNQKSTNPINDNQWHHVVLTRDADSGDIKVYVDGVLENTGSSANGNIGTPFSSIGRIDDTAGSPEYFEGDLDEVKIYDSVLDDSDVSAIFNSTHACPATGAGECVADYAVYAASDLDVGDRIEMNGVEVFGSGNAIEPDSAQIVTAAPPLPNFEPAGFPSFSGSDLQIPPPGNNPVSAGDYDEIQVNNNQTVTFDTSNGNDFRIQSLQTNNNVTVNMQAGRYFIDEMELGNDTTLNIVGGGTVELFIGDQFEAGDRSELNLAGEPGDFLVRMYDGAQLEFNNDVAYVGTIYAPGDDTEVQIGDRGVINGGIFSGGDVELNNDVELFYNNNAEVSGRIVAQCDGGPAHYAIIHDGTGVTCEAEAVTFVAHDSNDDPVDPGAVTLNLSTTTGRGDWSGIIAGGGSLNNGAQGDGSGSYTFPGGESSVTLAFNYTEIPGGQDSDSFFFDLNDGAVGDLGNGNPEDPEMIFSRTGFRFINQTDGNTIIPTQIAGKPSDIAPLAKALALQAIRSSDDDPSVCEGAFPAGEDRTIDLAAECRDPVSCSGQSMVVNGNTITTNNDDTTGGSSAYTPVTLSFDSDSTAPLILDYPDAGTVQLHARYNIPLEDGTGTPSGDFMLGSSNNFVVRPFGFHITLDGNPGSTDADSAIFREAGVDFDATVRAVAWQAADDGDNDGRPDAHTDTDPGNNVDLSDNPATPNFGQEASPEQAVLESVLDQPAGGNDGALGGGTGVTGFSNGEATTTLNYNEVGIIEISATNTDYLGSAQELVGASGYVGRFIPFDFDVELNTPEFASACSGGANDFTYIGQPFDYLAQPVMTVTARAQGGSTTENYRDDFFKLTNSKLDSDGDKTYTAETGTLDTNLITTPDPAIQSNADGTATLTFNSGTGIAFERDDPEAPFDAEISLSMNVIDEDDVVYGDGSGNNLNPVRFGEASAGDGIAFADSKEQRWGRIKLENAFGSERLDLQLPVHAEYFDGTSFIRNTDDDGCTTLAVEDFDLTGTLEGSTTASLPDGESFDEGRLLLNFSAPGTPGYIEAEALLGVAGADLTHLQFDWNSDGTYDNNPRGRASFGIYSGNSELIYIREPW
ncbi:MSHA biogenesis protein MshQ [Methylohalomonas lacus]|uniref:MSHA biogenesis protein MshQ n=1 Tax=Methylohalomonas lacus TaxID=398773 RepID=A0AAE3HNK9_9GAMM|nr:DUF6701 domain-containing protein [Methylohalomonas lacus]MCS3903947.1 MSHA biogenesis protein MshQ [Methylohalomonas lacus]